MMDWRKIAMTAFLIFSGIIRTSAAEPQESVVSAKLKWSLKQTFKVPESVLYDSLRNVIYVSNINGSPGAADGNGFIAKVSPEGKLLTLRWISGLNAPKGMAIYRDALWVADLNAIVQIDIIRGEIVRKFDLKARFLNDLTVDDQGSVYCSDNVDDRIYCLRNGRPTIWIDGGLDAPNGLLAEANRLVMLSSATGYVNFIDYQKKTIRKSAHIDGSPDGIVAVRNGYLLSDFRGTVYHLAANGKLTKIVDTKAQNISAADIGYIPGKKLLLVPTFSNNSLDAYEISD